VPAAAAPIMVIDRGLAVVEFPPEGVLAHRHGLAGQGRLIGL
jgi:hypothetical protein